MSLSNLNMLYYIPTAMKTMFILAEGYRHKLTELRNRLLQINELNFWQRFRSTFSTNGSTAIGSAAENRFCCFFVFQVITFFSSKISFFHIFSISLLKLSGLFFSWDFFSLVSISCYCSLMHFSYWWFSNLCQRTLTSLLS